MVKTQSFSIFFDEIDAILEIQYIIMTDIQQNIGFQVRQHKQHK